MGLHPNQSSTHAQPLILLLAIPELMQLIYVDV